MIHTHVRTSFLFLEVKLLKYHFFVFNRFATVSSRVRIEVISGVIGDVVIAFNSALTKGSSW